MPRTLKRKIKFDGSILYERRMAVGLTLQDLAKKINKTTATLWCWEREKAEPSPKSILALADALNTKPIKFYRKNEQ